MVGSHKGNSNNGGGSRGKAYGMMLILAFGAALFGVLVIHKLRERRIFNLLVHEKDRQLFSLQLLLQKESEYAKEMKKKSDGMKAKIYSLRNINMESDRRILELQSTIDSLKDEQKILESALNEKQNEIKMNQSSISVEQENENPIALTETLKQKEAEIDDLKRHLEKSLNRSADYIDGMIPARGNGSESTTTTVTEGENSALNESKERITDKEQQENGEDHSKVVEDLKLNSLEGLRNEDAVVNGTLDSQDNSNNTGMKLANDQDRAITRDEQPGLEKSQQDRSHNQGKLEITENSISSNSRVKVKHGKEKRWKQLARNRSLGSNQLARNRRLGSNRNRKIGEDESIRKRKYLSNNQKLQKESSDGIKKIEINAENWNPLKEERAEETDSGYIDHETNGGNGEFYKELVSDFEENKEKYKEESEESEF